MSQAETEVVDTGANEIRLVGRVSAAPTERTLPSGAVISGFRLVVARSDTAMTRGSATRSDWFDCTAWTAKTRRTTARWRVGDIVEVTGAARRRHYKTPTGGGGSRVEVEMLSGRRLRGG